MNENKTSLGREIKTVLVTGAAGLIGSAVTRKLLEEGKEVVACDNFSIGGWTETPPGLNWIKTDITDNEFLKQLNSYAIDAVVHCAAHPGGKSLREPSLDVKVNAYGSMILFEWCANKSVDIIYLSSSAIYGHQPQGLISEKAELHPGTVYAVCKQACENYLKVLGAAYGLNWTVLRLFATYGAGHRPSTFQGIVNIMLTQLLSGNQLVVKGSLQRERDLVYIDDVAEAIVQCVSNLQTRNEIINISTGQTTTIETLIRKLCDLLGRDYSDLNIVEQHGTVGDPMYNVGDYRLAQQLIDFEPAFNLEQGLQALISNRK